MPVLEEAVVTADAYLLFYQKSSLSAISAEPKPEPSTSSISSGYLSSVTCSSFNVSHWSFQMPPFNYYSNGNDKSNTLPIRKVVQPIKANASTSYANRVNNNNPRPNLEATKPVNNHIQQNSGKRPDQTAPSKSNSSASNNYNNTFPRSKIRQASH